jgi:uncharacterized protein YbaP (TraB family)
MKKQFFTSLSFIAIATFQFVPALAQTAPASAPSPAAQATTRTATPALWVVKDADTTIYLFGTFHLLPEGINWNYGAVKEAFERSDTLKLEIANIEAEAPAIAATMQSRGRLPEGKKLSDGLNAEQQANLARVIAETGIPPQAMENLQPWLASMLMSLTMFQKLGLDPNKGIDKSLDQLARAANKPVEGFETGAEQIGFFADLGEAQQRAMLLSTIVEWDQGTKMMGTMVDAWATGDSDTMASIMNHGLKDQPEFEKVLLTDRNQRWADWIASRMAQPGTVFVAVGTGHLSGRHSVQRFLSAKGFRAQRVKTGAAAHSH